MLTIHVTYLFSIEALLQTLHTLFSIEAPINGQT